MLTITSLQPKTVSHLYLHMAICMYAYDGMGMALVNRLFILADWKRLGSKAVEVVLEDVYVTVEPRTDFTVDEVYT